MSFIYNSYNTFTLILVIISITCLLSSDTVDCYSKRQQEMSNERQQEYSSNTAVLSNNQASNEQADSDESNIGRLIRSTRAREEASLSPFIEPKRRRSKRLQMMDKDEDKSSSPVFDQNSQSGQRDQEEKAKQKLRKRWHKLADDLIDDVFANQQQQEKGIKFLDSSYKKKKWFAKQQQQEKNSDNGIEKIMILMKKPLHETSSDSDDANTVNENENENENTNKNNLNNLLLTLQPQQQLQEISGLSPLNSIRRPNVNMQEHARRILDDKFGIMKESIFTTNNHLGLKGVPKLGSDEEY